MLRIVTDGAADLPAGWEQEFDVHIIPVNIQFGNLTYLQRVDLDNEAFYRKVDETKTIPKTSQPSPHQFVEFYKKVAQPGDTILSMHVTSKLSGTYASSVQAAEDLKGTYDVRPFDSMCGSVGIGFMCREARLMDRAGKSVDEILHRMDNVRRRVRIYLTLDTLEYAKMSGRVGAMQAALASLMNVKPIAVLNDGALTMVEKVRTRKASVKRLIEMAENDYMRVPVHLGVVQANDPASGKELLEEAPSHFMVEGEPVMTDLSIAVAANLGPGTVGLVLYPTD